MTVLEIDEATIDVRAGSRLGALLGRGPARLRVVEGVSLTLDAGETLGIVGESGSGKTTLGRAMLGLVPLASGRVRIDGAAAEGWGDGPWRHIRRDAALIFQDAVAALNPRMTVARLVTEPLVIHGACPKDRRAEAVRLLETVGLSAELAHRYPHELSGGQARRVTVARALALRPKLVIADEPTAGLDVSVQGELLNLLGGLQRDFGLAYVIITHNLAVARHVTDRLAIIYLGQLVECGPTEAIFRDPAHPYTRALLAAGTRHGAGQETPPIRGEVPSLWARPSGCGFHTRCPMAQPLCRQVAPPLRRIGPDHTALCHFASEVSAP